MRVLEIGDWLWDIGDGILEIGDGILDIGDGILDMGREERKDSAVVLCTWICGRYSEKLCSAIAHNSALRST